MARALGAGQQEDASRLAQQALLIAALLAVLFMVALLGFGRGIFSGMGGRGPALDAALAYANVLFGGAVIIWFTNVLAAVVRGAGNMLLPSLLLLGTALLHLPLAPLLVFGWGPLPGMGVAGAAASTLTVNALSALVMVGYLLRRHGVVSLRRTAWWPRAALWRDILRVGLPASMSPVISNASIAVSTAFVGHYGTAALAATAWRARLEYIPGAHAFGFGTALTAMWPRTWARASRARACGVAWLGGGVVAAITAPSAW